MNETSERDRKIMRKIRMKTTFFLFTDTPNSTNTKMFRFYFLPFHCLRISLIKRIFTSTYFPQTFNFKGFPLVDLRELRNFDQLTARKFHKNFFVFFSLFRRRRLKEKQKKPRGGGNFSLPQTTQKRILETSPKVYLFER